MDICKRVFCVVASCFISLAAFSGVLRSASAASGTQQLTPTQTRDLIGTTIPAKYFDGTDYVDFTFTYGGTSQVDLITAQPAPSFAVGDTVIYYTADLSSVSTNPQYITVDLRPQYSFFDTETVYQFCGLSSNRSNPTPATSVYAPPSWRWHDSITGDRIFESDYTYNSGANYGYFRANAGSDYYEPSFVEASFSSQSTFSAYSYRCCFYGNSLQAGRYVFFISCPIISADSTVASGTDIGTTSSGSGGAADITVNVDMTETNTFLGGILDFLEGLLQGIAALFVPSHEDFLEWLDDLHNLLREHFGAFVDTMLIIDSVFDSIPGNPEEELYIQLPYDVAVPGVPMVFTMQDWTFPLVPTGWAWLVDMLKDFGDILVTIAFINMVRNRWEHFLDPDSPET